MSYAVVLLITSFYKCSIINMVCDKEYKSEILLLIVAKHVQNKIN